MCQYIFKNSTAAQFIHYEFYCGKVHHIYFAHLVTNYVLVKSPLVHNFLSSNETYLHDVLVCRSLSVVRLVS